MLLTWINNHLAGKEQRTHVKEPFLINVNDMLNEPGSHVNMYADDAKFM